MVRESRYNVLAENDGEWLLFNTASGAFAALDAPVAERLGQGALLAAEERVLSRAGFLTEVSAREEVGALRARFEENRRDHEEFTLVIAPTYACNYRCPYCYEQDKTALGGMMGDEVMDAIVRFAQARFAEHAFSKLSVQWYGGDPSLALGAVERLSNLLIAWCDAQGVRYDALMLTNCNLIDDAAAAMLARCRITQVLLTIDGFEQTHNKRRVAADGSNSFARVVGAAKLFSAHGVQVSAIMNVDKVNWPEYHPLRDWLRDEAGIELRCGRLSDCGHFFGTKCFKNPDFDLFDMDEFARLEHEEFACGGVCEGDVRDVLCAPPRFCNGQRDDYYVIDCFGDVYACDGYVGDKRHVEFNVLDSVHPAPEKLRAISHDPFVDAECRECWLLPICLGNCDWERRTDQMQCHPLKLTLPGYLRDWRACACAGERACEGIELLA